VLENSTISRVESYWAEEMGLPAGSLFGGPLQIVTHGERLADYHGIFAIFRGDKATVSFPPADHESIRYLLPDSPVTPQAMAEAFAGFRVIGPAFIGYAAKAPSAPDFVRSLDGKDSPFSDALRAECSEEEWDHGGSDVGEVAASGAFVGGKLVALAGYEIWEHGIAHISIVTHPEYRGRGYGRGAVAHLMGRTLAAGLIPQYRTLDANTASIRIAESLGFERYATSVAVRLGERPVQ